MTLRLPGILVAAVTLLACNEGSPPPPATGSLDVQWQVPAILATQPLIADTIVVVRTANGGVFAYRRATGGALWGFFGAGINRDIPLQASGDFLVIAHGAIRVADIRSGETVWERVDPSGVGGSMPPVVDAGVIYATEFTAATALDVATGDERWSTHLPGAIFPPALGSDVVVYHVRELLTFFQELQGGELVALDRETGEEQWRVDLAGTPSFRAATPGITAFGDRIIAPTYDGRLVAISLADGTPLWDIPDAAPPGQYATAPIAFGGHAVIARTDGTIEARSLTDGSLVWSATARPFSHDAPPVACGAYLCVSNGALRLLGPTGAFAWDSYDESTIAFTSAAASDASGILFAGAAAEFGDYRLIALKPRVELNAPQ